MSGQPIATPKSRQAVFDALRIGAPSSFNDEMREAFLTAGSNLILAELDMDSLGEMEFCIAIELSTGVTLLPSQLAALGSTDAIEHLIREKLNVAPGPGG